jgi:oxygen-dependent protoporphyrinogen oxidase
MPPARMRAVVVGGGLAGLVAAHRLERRGARVVLCEAREQAGGSLAAGLEPLPSVVPRSAPHLAALSREVGAELARLPLEDVCVPGRRGPRSRSTRTRASIGRGPLAALRLARLQSVAEWLGARVDPAEPERETRLDDRSVTDLCHLYLGRRAERRLFAPLLESLGLDARETSRELLFAWMNASGDVELSLAFGLADLCSALASSLSDLRLGARVEAVLPGGCGVRLASGERIDSDALVVATGAHEAVRLVPDLSHVERDVLAACAVHSERWLVLRAPHALRPPARLGWPGGEVAALFDATPPGCTDASLIALRARTTADAAQLLSSAQRLVPGLSRTVCAQREHTREGAPSFGVGHFRRIARLRLEAQRRPERRIALCGDYLVGPGAEACAASGERAAHAVLQEV